MSGDDAHADGVADDLVDEQIAYYRARAPEYDEWWLRLGKFDAGDELARRWEAEKAVVNSALANFEPRGRVLDVAAGTGNFTVVLASTPAVESVLAVDASPEALDIARAKVAALAAGEAAACPVEFEVADLFSWSPPGGRFDLVFFSFWLSHVPPARFASFWQLVRSALAPGGRVFFVDNALPLEAAAARLRTASGAAASAVQTPWSTTDLDRGVSIRELNDGRRFSIVKRLWSPDELAAELASLGWRGDVAATETAFIYGRAVPA